MIDLKGRVVVLSVSGGKDSAAAALHLRELGIEHIRVFADTGWEHAATYEYLRGPLTDLLGPITEVRGLLGFADLVRKKRLFPDRTKRFCTTELKGAGLSSELIREAVAATRFKMGEPPELGMVSFVDPDKVKHKRDPGRCFIKAGFKLVGETKGGLLAFQMLEDAMPAPDAPLGADLELFEAS